MTGAREEPWWASGSGETLGDEDPFDAHRSARHGEDGSDPWLRLIREFGEGHKRLDGETCGVCPLCSALAALGNARPELLHHLSEAARHLMLAAKAFVDAQAASYAPTDLQRIEVEDDDPSAGPA